MVGMTMTRSCVVSWLVGHPSMCPSCRLAPPSLLLAFEHDSQQEKHRPSAKEQEEEWLMKERVDYVRLTAARGRRKMHWGNLLHYVHDLAQYMVWTGVAQKKF